VPRRIGKGSRELYTAASVLGVQPVRILNGQIGVEQLVGVFVGIRRGRFGATRDVRERGAALPEDVPTSQANECE
jgi:hypothetical protein